jgi:hypothetical protein
MNQEEINLKVEELTKREGVQVYPIVVEYKDETIIGFVKEPKRQAKLAAIDDFWAGKTTSACEMVLRAGFIPDASDSRLISDDAKDDDIVVAAIMACIGVVKIYTANVKKN